MHGSMTACHMAAGHEGPHTWDLRPSPARRGVDKLLAVMGHREIESIDSQQQQPLYATDIVTGEQSLIAPAGSPGPWVIVKFVGGDEFAVWKATGAVYRVGADGAVDEDPMLTVDA